MAKLIGVMSFLVIAVLGGCDSMNHTRCNDKILSQEKSPDEKYVAIMYQRSCANNTGQYTCVNLQEAATTRLAEQEAEPVLTIRGFYKITATWTGPNSLEIRSEGLQDQKAVLTQHGSWKTVVISYKN